MALCGDTPGPIGINDFAQFSTVETYGRCDAQDIAELLFSSPPPVPAGTAVAPKKPKIPDAISQAGIEMIEGFEGFRATMYNDVAGHCTIGYGQLIHKGRCTGKAPAEKPYLKGITREKAEALLRQKVSSFESVIKASVTVELNQNQFDALVSFVYNVGPDAFQRSTLLKKLNKGQYDAVPGELMKYVHAGGKTVEGLVTRRKAESSLFATP